MMRFKEGSKVEVMNNRELPISWCTAEILSGNGHTYTVRYDCFPLLGMKREAPSERVSRKLIRPCPPPVEGLENLVAGDIVEVFDNFSWKIASILKVVSREQYLVRLLGCSEEFCIHRSNIRVRQVWQDDKWTMLGKGSGGCGFVQSDKLSASKSHQKMSFPVAQSDPVAGSQAPKDCPALQSNGGLEESRVVSSRSLKRMSPYCSSIIELPTRYLEKIRVIEKDGRRERVISAPVLKKVDAVVYPGEILGEKYMHASFNNDSYVCIKLERENLDRDLDCSPMRSSEPNGYDSDASSVGSCSAATRSPNNFRSHCVPVPCQVTDSICSDAEFSYGSMDEEKSCPHPPEEEVVARVHRLELHAYRCTLGALYASGPLTWEQEALLTNFRITLHISNDEHLVELKNLISAKSTSYIR